MNFTEECRLGYAFVTKAIYNRSPSLTLHSGCFPMPLTLKRKESKRKYHLTRPYAKALQTKPNSIKLSTVSQVYSSPVYQMSGLTAERGCFW